jgi:hypothetical protein
LIDRSIHRRRFLRTAAASLIGVPLALSRVARLLAAPPDQDAPPAPDDASPEGPTPADEWVPYGAPPRSLAIPKLGVDARVVGVGQDPDGAMGSPSDPDEVAWYTLGPGMGVPGNVVFAGHVDWGGRDRVFSGLRALAPGDVVLVVDQDKNGYQYLVESVWAVRADGAPVEEIFGQSVEPVITLITCGGAFNQATREYVDRVIVRAKGSL